jgi:DNA-binding transcriptional ArsR family regulator
LSSASTHIVHQVAKPELPTRLELLSTELLVAREIYASQLSKGAEPMFFNRLSETLTERGLASRGTVSKALDMLFDQGIIKAEWKQRSDGKYVRALTIAGEAQKFVEAIYKHTSKD